MKKVLLVQVREKAFADQELESIRNYLQADITVVNALHAPLTADLAQGFDAIIFGGSGECNVSKDQPRHLPNLLAVTKSWVEAGIPFLGICFGAHVLARALGGEIVLAPEKKEVGDTVVHLKEQQDPLLADLPAEFHVGVGHIDAISQLPDQAVSLARTDLVDHHIFRVQADQPVYGIQFHPELNKAEHQERMRLVFQLTGTKYFKDEQELQEKMDALVPTPEASSLFERFLSLIDKRA